MRNAQKERLSKALFMLLYKVLHFAEKPPIKKA